MILSVCGWAFKNYNNAKKVQNLPIFLKGNFSVFKGISKRKCEKIPPNPRCTPVNFYSTLNLPILIDNRIEYVYSCSKHVQWQQFYAMGYPLWPFALGCLSPVRLVLRTLPLAHCQNQQTRNLQRSRQKTLNLQDQTWGGFIFKFDKKYLYICWLSCLKWLWSI